MALLKIHFFPLWMPYHSVAARETNGLSYRNSEVSFVRSRNVNTLSVPATCNINNFTEVLSRSVLKLQPSLSISQDVKFRKRNISQILVSEGERSHD